MDRLEKDLMRAFTFILAKYIGGVLCAFAGFALAFSLMRGISVSAANTESGPFCWAGIGEDGRDRYIPCHHHAQEVILYLDESSFGSLRLVLGSRTVIASREQVLKALANWELENRAKP
jgi:hypothetical protein